MRSLRVQLSSPRIPPPQVFGRIKSLCPGLDWIQHCCLAAAGDGNPPAHPGVHPAHPGFHPAHPDKMVALRWSAPPCSSHGRKMREDRLVRLVQRRVLVCTGERSRVLMDKSMCTRLDSWLRLRLELLENLGKRRNYLRFSIFELRLCFYVSIIGLCFVCEVRLKVGEDARKEVKRWTLISHANGNRLGSW